MVEMTFQLYQTQLKPVYKPIAFRNSTLFNATMFNSTMYNETMFNSTIMNLTEEVAKPEIDYYTPTPAYRRGLDVLGLVVFCITFGAVLAQMEEKGTVMVQFFESLNEASIRIIRLVMWLA